MIFLISEISRSDFWRLGFAVVRLSADLPRAMVGRGGLCSESFSSSDRREQLSEVVAVGIKISEVHLSHIHSH